MNLVGKSYPSLFSSRFKPYKGPSDNKYTIEMRIVIKFKSNVGTKRYKNNIVDIFFKGEEGLWEDIKQQVRSTGKGVVQFYNLCLGVISGNDTHNLDDDIDLEIPDTNDAYYLPFAWQLNIQ